MAESQASRIAFLRERVERARAAGGPTFDVPFRQRQEDLHRIEVPIGFPLYRLQSGRTHRAQSKYVDDHGLPPDFFDDPESDEAQEAQHHILVAMIDEANLRADLLAKDQRRPLVLTYDGFIVDGNRRTAALRDQDDVENVTAVVLPDDAQAPDYYETELELQMAVDTKAPYNWVDEGLHVRLGVQQLDEPVASIARRMNMADADVTEILGRMALVDLYLEWLGAPGKYHRIGAGERTQDEQSFIELHQRERRQRFKNLPELHQRAVRYACFAVIRYEQGGYKEIRKVADTTIAQLDQVAKRLHEELPEPLRERLNADIEVPPAPEGEDDLLGRLAEADVQPGVPPGAEVLNVVAGPADVADVAPAIVRVAEDLVELENERREQGQPLRKVERALRLLNEVDLAADTPGLADIARVLAQVVARAEELAERIDALSSERQ